MNNADLTFFLIDFEGNSYVEKVNKLKNIYFKTPVYSNYLSKKKKNCRIIKKEPVEFEQYKKSFNKVIDEIKKGNTYLLNLTAPTFIKSDCSLKEIFFSANAPFKLYFKNKFVCFSPERFVRIDNGKIFTYPMKGTIDATLPNAEEIILKDIKESAEHTMVVDLLRNDLGIIGKNVKVNKFRFISKITTDEKPLLQVSSEIEATLPNNWGYSWLNILKRILPAGSVTGTPKKKTVEIIKSVENYKRDFYTGIFGVTDEKTFLESAVIIRYIQKEENRLVYKSGGGITIDSNAKKEYEELIKKVYIPI